MKSANYVAVMMLVLVLDCLLLAEPEIQDAAPIKRTTVEVQGWTILIDEQLLLPEYEELYKGSFQVLQAKLADIKRVLPEDKVSVLQTCKIAVDLDHPKSTSMGYHPSVNWLKNHGYSTELAKTVHIPQAHKLMSRRNAVEQPWVILHELAHAYHDQVLGRDDPRIKHAYTMYQQSGRGEKTLLFNGERVKHYGLTNDEEFFAEMTEAYFGVNDFFPFNRAELMEHEPAIYRLMKEIWETPLEPNTPDAKDKSKAG